MTKSTFETITFYAGIVWEGFSILVLPVVIIVACLYIQSH